MKTVSIIGAGKVGTSLGIALVRAGFQVTSLSCLEISSAEESRDFIGQGEPTQSNIKAAREGQMVFLTVPDNTIEIVARELASSNLVWQGRYIFHCSGILPASILKDFKDKGAAIASIHPIQSFSKKNNDARIFQNIYFGMEGDEEAVRKAWQVSQLLGGRPILIRAEDKPVLHTSFSVTSNFFVVLLDMAVSLLKSTGLDENKATQILFPLVRGTFQNIMEKNIQSALTGPVIRGDGETVKTHLKILEENPSFKAIYQKMATQALRIAQEEEKKNPQKFKELKQLLEDK